MTKARANVSYSEYHPRWYRPSVSTWWWLGRWPYLKFILREISSVFVAWGVVVLLLHIHALSQGPAQYAEFEAWLRHPLVLTLNLLSLTFVTFHAVTWFSLAPKAMVVRLRGKRVPDFWIAFSNYAAWVVASVLVGWLLLRG